MKTIKGLLARLFLRQIQDRIKNKYAAARHASYSQRSLNGWQTRRMKERAAND